MPFYEYQCPQGHVTELFRPIDGRDDPVLCTRCEEQCERILSPTPTTFVCAGGRKL